MNNQSTWEPDQDSVQQLADLLNQSQSTNQETQNEIFKKITQLYDNPEFPCYLAYIVSIQNKDINSLRQTAGITLKSVLEKVSDKIPNQNLDYVKRILINCFNDETQFIRKAVAIASTALFCKIGPKKWPQLLELLSKQLVADNAEAIETALDCLWKILEDIKVNIENVNIMEDGNNQVLNQLVPNLIQLCNPELPRNIKSLALYCLNLFANFMPPSLTANMNDYMEVLDISSKDKFPLIRQRSIEGLSEILATRKDLISQHLNGILELVVKCTLDSEPDVQKAGIKFWNEFLLREEHETMDRLNAMKKYFDPLIPTMIDCLRITEEDLINMGSTKADTMGNIFHGDQDDDGIVQVNDDEDEGYDEDDEGDGDGRADGEWTLRRETAYCLDNMARIFEDDVYYAAEKKLAECLKSTDWRIKESGISAFGSISKGCYNVVQQNLGDMYPFLMNCLQEESHNIVVSTSIWTMSTFTGWICEEGRRDEDILLTYLRAILQRMLHDDPTIQQSSCTALSKICYHESIVIEKYIKDIMDIIKQANQKYTEKSMKGLYDMIATMADSLPHELIKSSDVEKSLMEILEKRWTEAPFNDFESMLLVECTETVLNSLEDHVKNYCEYFAPKSLILIENYFQAKDNNDKKYVYHKKEIAIRALDLFSSLVKQVGNDILQIISVDDYLHVFAKCLKDRDLIIKQFIFSSAGDMAKHAPKILENHVKEISDYFLQDIVAINKDIPSLQLFKCCCNNASWAVGEMCKAYPQTFHGMVGDFAKRATSALTESGQIHRVMAQNLAICLGRLGLVNPDAVAPYLPKFLKHFCLALEKTRNDEEKTDAFKGLFQVIHSNPNGIVEDFMFLCHTLTVNEFSDDQLNTLSTELISNFKKLAGEKWNEYYNSFPPNLRSQMTQKFGV